MSPRAAGPTDEEARVGLVRSFLAAWNTDDVEATLDFFAADAVVVKHAASPPASGGHGHGHGGDPGVAAGLRGRRHRMVGSDYRATDATVTWAYRESLEHRGLGVTEGRATAVITRGTSRGSRCAPCPDAPAPADAPPLAAALPRERAAARPGRPGGSSPATDGTRRAGPGDPPRPAAPRRRRARRTAGRRRSRLWLAALGALLGGGALLALLPRPRQAP